MQRLRGERERARERARERERERERKSERKKEKGERVDFFNKTQLTLSVIEPHAVICHSGCAECPGSITIGPNVGK